MNIKKDDRVIVITGKDKGSEGRVLRALPKENKIIVEGVNIKKHHQRAKKTGQKGQIIDKTFPIHVSNVRKVGGEEKKKPETKKKTVKANVTK